MIRSFNPNRRISSFFSPAGNTAEGLDQCLGMSATEEAAKEYYSDLDSF